MTPEQQAICDSDLAAIEWNLMTWAGADYPGELTVLDKSDALKEGGWQPDYGGSFYVRTSLFSTIPKVDDTVTISGKQYRISVIKTHPDGVQLELVLAVQ